MLKSSIAIVKYVVALNATNCNITNIKRFLLASATKIKLIRTQILIPIALLLDKKNFKINLNNAKSNIETNLNNTKSKIAIYINKNY